MSQIKIGRENEVEDGVAIKTKEEMEMEKLKIESVNLKIGRGKEWMGKNRKIKLEKTTI